MCCLQFFPCKNIAASRQAQIVELGGLKLLLPLANSRDIEVQRLAVHALANLSVDCESQVLLLDYCANNPFWLHVRYQVCIFGSTYVCMAKTGKKKSDMSVRCYCSLV